MKTVFIVKIVMKKKCLKLTNMDYTKTTLGELLSSFNKTIKRNATSILKQLQKEKPKITLVCEQCLSKDVWSEKGKDEYDFERLTIICNKCGYEQYI